MERVEDKMMTSYEYLLARADEDLIVKELDLKGNDGLIHGHRIAIKKSLSTIEKTCVLAEELGHYQTTVGDILDQSDANNRKQEHRARVWAYNEVIGLHGLVQAYQAGCKNRYETAAYLEVTEAFLQEAIDYYTSKYGVYVDTDNYRVQFIPC